MMLIYMYMYMYITYNVCCSGQHEPFKGECCPVWVLQQICWMQGSCCPIYSTVMDLLDIVYADTIPQYLASYVSILLKEISNIENVCCKYVQFLCLPYKCMYILYMYIKLSSPSAYYTKLSSVSVFN